MIASTQGQWLTSIFFLLFIAASIGMTVWSMRRSRSASGFFVAGRNLSGWKNGLALSGDYMSAASFLGIAGLVSLFGFDGIIYSFGLIAGWIIIVLLVAEPLRNAGKYTLSDIMAFRLRPKPVRAAAALSSVTISMFHLLGQLIGASAIVSLLLPIDAGLSIVVVGVLMVSYVLFGGMVATTYVQMVKAVLVFFATTFLTVLLLSRFDFSVSSLLSAAATASGKGESFLSPGLYFTNKLDLISLGLGLVLGTAGLPHIMMRFYTVPAAKDARTSANWVIGLVGAYCVMTTVLGFGAAALVGHDKISAASKAGNSAAPLLALNLGGGSGTLGGEMLIAFISAVTFATILAVVAGLLIAAASNIAHDIYTHVVKNGVSDGKNEVIVAKIATVAVGIVAITLSLSAKSLNVAFLVGLAYAVAASANFPVILYSLYWRRFNTTGALCALIVGLISSVGLVLVGPAVIGAKGLMFTDVQPLTTLTNPGIISIPLGFLAGWLGTVLSARERTSEESFVSLKVRALTGYGAEASTSGH